MIRCSFPFFVPKILSTALMTDVDKNPLHDGVRNNLTGIKKIATSQSFYFRQMKATARKMGITINDFLTACISSAVKKTFEEMGDKEVESMNIAIPANIRFKYYDSIEEVKMENKFAVIYFGKFR